MIQYVSQTEESAITRGGDWISMLPHPCDQRGHIYCHMRLWHGGWRAKHWPTKLLLNGNVCQCPAGSCWEGCYGRKMDTNGSPPHIQQERPCQVWSLVYLGCPSDIFRQLHSHTIYYSSGMQNHLIGALCCLNNPSRIGKGTQGKPELIASSSSASCARALQTVFPTCMAFLPALQKCLWAVQHGHQRHLLPQDPCIR